MELNTWEGTLTKESSTVLTAKHAPCQLSIGSSRLVSDEIPLVAAFHS